MDFMSSLTIDDAEAHAAGARKILTAQAVFALLGCMSASDFAAWSAAQLALALWGLSSLDIGREDARSLFCLSLPLRWLLGAIWLGLWTHPMATSSGVNHYGATVHFLLLCMWLHFVLESFGCWFWYKLWKNGGLENNGGGFSGGSGGPMLSNDGGGMSHQGGGEAYAAPPPDPFGGSSIPPSEPAQAAGAGGYQNVG